MAFLIEVTLTRDDVLPKEHDATLARLQQALKPHLVGEAAIISTPGPPAYIAVIARLAAPTFTEAITRAETAAVGATRVQGWTINCSPMILPSMGVDE